MRCKLDKEKNDLNKILYYYEIKMNGFGSFSTVVWSRFNWFLTIELAVLSVYLKFMTGELKQVAHLEFFIAGLIVTSLWLILGIEDFMSHRRTKERLNKLEDDISELLNKDIENSPSKFWGQSLMLIITPILLGGFWVYLFLVG